MLMLLFFIVQLMLNLLTCIEQATTKLAPYVVDYVEAILLLLPFHCDIGIQR